MRAISNCISSIFGIIFICNVEANINITKHLLKKSKKNENQIKNSNQIQLAAVCSAVGIG
jgi:hypothetical protein